MTGDKAWYHPEMIEGVLNRLLLSYGPDLVNVHGSATGIDRSFAVKIGIALVGKGRCSRPILPAFDS